MMASISQVVRERMEQAFRRSGLEGCQEVLQSDLDEWQRTQMNVAVIGLSGTGKSSLINAFLDLNADDEGAAEVGSNETTVEIQSYKHPNNHRLVFTDLPGVGTPRFPKESYLRRVEVDKYDFFLLVTVKRFREDDGWLAKELKQRNKGFFFVRTHIGVEVSNDKAAHPKKHDEAKLIADIRSHTQCELKQICEEHEDPASSLDVKVFLVDNHLRMEYDFPDLFNQFVDDFPKLKQEALLLSMRTQTRAIVDLKAERLRSRIWKCAAISAGCAAVPIPGISFVTDACLLLRESKFYYHQLGLDSQSLRRLAEATGVEVGRLEAIVMQAFAVDIMSMTITNFVSFLGRCGCTMAAFEVESAAEAAVSLLPVIGQALAASMSYWTTRWMLGKILDHMHAVAKQVVDVAMQPRNE